MAKKSLILIVDDNADNRKLLGGLLSKEGYEIGVAKDGYHALEFVQKVEPDLILLDVMMPKMDGYEVCRRLKSETITKHIPIIFLTARTATKDIVKGFEMGGVDYVSKPFSNAELLARVNTHIELNTLKGLLPICSSCKNIRDDDGYWHAIEEYFQTNSNVYFSHGLCEKCAEELYGNEPWFNRTINKEKDEKNDK